LSNQTKADQTRLNAQPGVAWDLLEITVITTAVAGFLYFLYFQLAPWIWAQNIPVRRNEILLWQLPWMKERDGIEIYALYFLMLLNLFLVYTLNCGWQKFFGGHTRYLLVLPLGVAGAFIATIGFHPPMSTFSEQSLSDITRQTLTVLLVLLPLTGLLYYLQQRAKYWTLAIAALLLIPVCFISTAPIEWYDYSLILAPALRLLDGVSIPEIYFQYDLLLSFIGLAWMKLGLDLNLFQVVGQCAYYLLLLGVFAFSRRWFFDKRLPVFLLVASVLLRIYAGPFDAIHSFQITPLRLDLWLILLMLMYFKRPDHWSAGVFCGVMLVLHKSFGIIYSAAYIELLLTLCIIETAGIPGKFTEKAITALRIFFAKNYRNLAMILAGAVTQYLLFRNANLSSDFSLVNLKIGFIRIASTSFYWYVVALSGLAFMLLLKLRDKLPANYLVAGLCLNYLMIGNSLYFFGRSHQNNILNISIILLLLLFLVIDMASRFLGKASGKPKLPFLQRNLGVIAGLALVTLITAWYGNSIIDKTSIQAANIRKGQFIYPSEVREQDIQRTLSEVKSVTGDNPKVYFVGDLDFLLNYYGRYTPVGYYSPVYAWISKREFNKFLQGLVGQGYYLVVDNGLEQEVLSSLNMSHYKYIQGYIVAW
jgi:hypothetical protein